MQTVINHATVLTMDPEKHIYKDGYVVMEGNTILETGEGEGPVADPPRRCVRGVRLRR